MHTGNRRLRSRRGLSAAVSHGSSVAFSNGVSLVSDIFQMIVTFPVCVYWKRPMGIHWNFPMELPFLRVLLCDLFRPESLQKCPRTLHSCVSSLSFMAFAIMALPVASGPICCIVNIMFAVLYTYIYIYIYTYVYRERDVCMYRERDIHSYTHYTILHIT